MNAEVIKANYLNCRYAKEIQELLNIYASKKCRFRSYELDSKAGVALFWQKNKTSRILSRQIINGTYQ